MKSSAFISRNNIEVSGRLTSDAAISDGKNGKVARFSLAHNFGKGMDALFLNIVMFSKNGKKDVEIPVDTLKKGAAVIVSGYLRPNNFKKQDGTTYRSIDLVALGVEAIAADPADEQAAEEAPAEAEEAPAEKPAKKASKK